MHTYQFRSIPRLSLTTVIAAAALVSACSDSPLLPPVETPEAAINFQRLLVADAQAPSGACWRCTTTRRCRRSR
jgi:hypothetical protein